MLALEEAVGVVALDLDGRGLDARLVAILVIHDGVLIAVALRPAGVHAEKFLYSLSSSSSMESSFSSMAISHMVYISSHAEQSF